MLTDRFAPAAMVKGKVNPVTANPGPVILAEKTVTPELPVFDRTTAFVAGLPTSTLPNEMLAGDALNRRVGGGVAVPESGMAGKAFEALLISVRLPVNVPAACGANWIVTVPDWAGPNVNGNVVAMTLKVAPLRFACDSVRLDPPVLVTTIACDDVVVAAMLLKMMLVGETAIVGGSTVTVTEAEADLLVSATLVARTVNVPAVLGAV